MADELGVLQLFLDIGQVQVYGAIHTGPFQEMHAKEGRCILPASRLFEAAGAEE